MAMETSSVQVEISSQRGQLSPLGDQEPDGAYISVIRAPAQKRNANLVLLLGCDPGIDQLKHEVGTTIGQLPYESIVISSHFSLRARVTFELASCGSQRRPALLHNL